MLVPDLEAGEGGNVTAQGAGTDRSVTSSLYAMVVEPSGELGALRRLAMFVAVGAPGVVVAVRHGLCG